MSAMALARQNADNRVKTDFERNTNCTIISQIDFKLTDRYHFYVTNADIQQAGNLPDAYAAIRSSVKAVKIIKPRNRSRNDHARPELDVLESIASGNHPNIVHVLGSDQRKRNWLQLRYSCASVEAVGRFNFTLPHAFFWSLTRDVFAALSYLHWGIQQDWKNDSDLPEHWRPIAHGLIGPATIHLDIYNPNQWGYPKALLVEFGAAQFRSQSITGEATSVEQWTPAKWDVSNAAYIVHTLAHGLEYANKPDDATGKWCVCLDDMKCPPWLDSETMDRELAAVLEMAYPIEDPEQLTSKALLAHINGAQGFSRRLPPDAPPIPWNDLQKLKPLMPTNVAIRTVVPALRGVYENEEDRQTGDADLTIESP